MKAFTKVAAFWTGVAIELLVGLAVAQIMIF
jgi:hypothetical protein